MDHAEQRADRGLATDLTPWVEPVRHPTVHPDLASLAAFPISDKYRATGAIELALLEREALADAQTGPPEQHDKRAESVAIDAITDDSHRGDDLVDRRWISRGLLAFVA